MTRKMEGSDVPMPPWGKQRKSTQAPREPLTVTRIVRAAIAIIDVEGSDALTMRGIAHKLGVAPSALYVHVQNRQDILNLVLEHVLESEVGLPELTGDWQLDVKRYFMRLQSKLSAHGDVAVVNFAAFPPTRIGIATTERLLTALLGAGVSPQVASWGLHRITLYTNADVYEGWQMRSRHMDEWAGPVRKYLEALPAADFPSISSSLDALLDEDSDGRFELGLEFLISGIANTVM
ncbi:TetR/AcrR family transcriptional regulator [Rhodococcus sp. H29-C3]|uniref:TetR/AcrR family transcriptional regulator n=1 Tax=Rhodococcus sp. H29-C3 TaxID=3046307 RepID=UPI0024BAFDA8|nr:TetR/AcrR family transcriptional regulator [Rhodococcus sp. H29-C3]MDJ0362475.1 TetR/AcrR family transcriptional regulator [Rhodococcus sp. H29-C3]